MFEPYINIHIIYILLETAFGYIYDLSYEIFYPIIFYSTVNASVIFNYECFTIWFVVYPSTISYT